jgi:hypothetical protein
MVILNTNHLEDQHNQLKQTMEKIEKIEKLMNYNLMFLLMLMQKLEILENQTGKMLEDFKLLVETGVHKSISKKLQKKVELILINQNKTN